MLKGITFVQVLDGYRLRVRFEDEIEGEIDVAKLVDFTGVFAALQERAFFERVRVNPDTGTNEWPNEADLDPDVLYAVVTGRPIPVLPEVDHAVSFLRVVVLASLRRRGFVICPGR